MPASLHQQLQLQSRLRRIFNTLAVLIEEGQCTPSSLQSIAAKIQRHDYHSCKEFAKDFEACIPEDNAFLQSQLQFELKNAGDDSDDEDDTSDSDSSGSKGGSGITADADDICGVWPSAASRKRGFVSDGHHAGESAAKIVHEAASMAEQALKRHKKWSTGAGVESSYPLMSKGGLGWRSREREGSSRGSSASNNAIPAQYAEACGLPAPPRQATPRSRSKKGHR